MAGGRGPQLTFGVHTFGEVAERDRAGVTAAQVVREVVDQAVLAEEVGLDFFGAGEHHGPGFVVSQPDVVLAAAAAATTRIRLGSAVSILSVHEPVFVHERFATLDAVSGSRAELAVGPGAFEDVFNLVGADFDRRNIVYDRRLVELLQLVTDNAAAAGNSPIIGRASLSPSLEHGALRVRAASSGSEATFRQAAQLSLPIILAVRDGDPVRFAPQAAEYFALFNANTASVPEVTLHQSGYVGETLEQAQLTAWPFVAELYAAVGAERGWRPMTWSQFQEQSSPSGPLLIGPADPVAAKIHRLMSALGATRFAFKYGIGAMPRALLRENIIRFGRKVAPLVRQAGTVTRGPQ